MELWRLIGFIMPPLIDLINRRIANGDIRFWLSLLICAVVGVGGSWLASGVLTWKAVEDIFVVFGMAQLTYQGVYRDSSLQEQIRA